MKNKAKNKKQKSKKKTKKNKKQKKNKKTKTFFLFNNIINLYSSIYD